MKYIKIIILAIVFLNFSCKNTNENLSKTKVNTTDLNITDTITEKNPGKIEISNNKNNNKLEKWVFNKAAPFSDLFTCDDLKYKDFNFSMSGDSVFIDGIYTDDVYRQTNKAEEVLKPKNELDLYRTFLPKNFNVKLPETLVNIKNKKAYQKDSKLDVYFQDAFFIDQYLFFNNNGCLYCFRKENQESNAVKSITLPITKSQLIDPNNRILANKSSIKLDGNLASAEYKIKEDVFLLWFDGDFEKWYLVTLINQAVKEKLLIGKNETVELKNGKTEDNYLDFSIDINSEIKLQYSRGKNYQNKKIYKEEKYKISQDKNIIKL